MFLFHTRTFLPAVVFCLIFSIVTSSQLHDEYCSQNLFAENPSNSTPFSKELTTVEYGIVGFAKSIHCCARGYESIRWYKNGEQYPWQSNVKFHLIVSGSSRNQTMYSHSLTKYDSGTYECEVIRQGVSYTHSFNLTVFDSGTGYTDIPLPTYRPEENQIVSIGKPLRLYCEAFVGKIDLPDAKSEIMWYHKESQNNSFPQNKVVSRDNGLTIGMYLIIDEVKSQDSGKYVCCISNAGDQKINATTFITTIEQSPHHHSLAERAWLFKFYIFCMILMLLSVLIYWLYLKYGHEMYIHIKQQMRKGNNDDSKEYDIFLLYEIKDEDFVLDTLIPQLITKYGYIVRSQILEENSAFTMECQSQIAASRCVIVIWSSQSEATSDDRGTVSADRIFLPKLHFITTLHSRVICVIVEDSEKVKHYRRQYAFNTLKAVDFIKWSRSQSDKRKNNNAWYTLRSCLPPKLSDSKYRRSRSSDRLYISIDEKGQASLQRINL